LFGSWAARFIASAARSNKDCKWDIALVDMGWVIAGIRQINAEISVRMQEEKAPV